MTRTDESGRGTMFEMESSNFTHMYTCTDVS